MSTRLPRTCNKDELKASYTSSLRPHKEGEREGRERVNKCMLCPSHCPHGTTERERELRGRGERKWGKERKKGLFAHATGLVSNHRERTIKRERRERREGGGKKRLKKKACLPTPLVSSSHSREEIKKKREEIKKKKCLLAHATGLIEPLHLFDLGVFGVCVVVVQLERYCQNRYFDLK
jgi:hypothetical protein